MKKNVFAVYVSLFVVFAGIGWAAGHVGSVSIRRVKPTDNVVTMQFTAPLTVGVRTQIHVTPAVGHSNAVQLFLRTSTNEQLIGEGQLIARRVGVVIPCSVSEKTGSLVMRERATEEVIAVADTTLLPPGPDCVH